VAEQQEKKLALEIGLEFGSMLLVVEELAKEWEPSSRLEVELELEKLMVEEVDFELVAELEPKKVKPRMEVGFRLQSISLKRLNE